MELMNCIHNLRSIRCSHCHIQVLRMGIHIHNRCMGCIHQSSLNLQCCLHSQRTNRFRNRDHSSFHRMDDFLRCFHNPSIRILHSIHCYHHSSHRSTSTNHLHVGCLMSIRNLRSIRCSHCHIQVLRMGVHIHNRCMGYIHQSSLNLQCCLHSQHTNRFRNRDHSSFHRMDDFLHCFHNPSNHILRSSRCCLHSSHRSTSTNHLHVECLMSIRSLRSIRCNHGRNQVLRMGIHIHNRCMGCILRSLMMTDHLRCSQRTNRHHSRNHNNLRGMEWFLHCFHNPSIHILRSNHCYHHSSHHSTSTNHLHVGCLMSIRSLRSIRCNHGRNQVLHMGIHIHNRCMGCILRSLMMTDHLRCSQHTNRYHSRNHNNLRGMEWFLHCFHNPSIRI